MSSSTQPLARYSKPHGAGDISSRGLDQIMGTTELSRVEMLLRETLQNAWDARLEGEQPIYGAEARWLKPESLQVLRHDLFADLPPVSPVKDSLAKASSAVVEVYDRGTSGLDGPLDPTSGEVDSEQSNFVKLVYDIGSTKPAGGGSGGTYGFGKTAAFTASASHTVVYWTACQTRQGPEHRLIAVCHGKDYVDSGTRFTGVHWWGEPAEVGGLVLPVRGEAARRLGEKLFSKRFAPGETGTSILILDPVLASAVAEGDGVGEEEVAEGVNGVTTRKQLRELQRQITLASAKFAWPKVTVPADAAAPPMALHIGGESDPAPDEIRGAPDLRPFKRLMNALRDYQEQGTSRESRETVIVDDLLMEIACRPLRKGSGGYYGDLAVAKVPNYRNEQGESHADWAMNRLCNMRHEAELVVNYEEIGGVEAEGYAWFAVFKPRAGFDAHFAAAEPPAHDRWTPGGGMSPESNATVRSAKRLVPQKIRQVLAPSSSSVSGGSESAVGVAEELSSFVPQGKASEIEGAAPRPPGERRASAKKRAAHVTLVSSQAQRLESGQHLYSLIIAAASSEVMVRLKIKARTAGKSELFDTGDVAIQWEGDAEAVFADSSERELHAGQQTRVEVFVPADTAIDVDLKGETLSDG
ncbi:hypothetical protein [Nesterenkonia populi]|uniref:hypothetical protein n=1 Tax=Nesterenkonia populi TaxID=1591087 RepID=UPI0011BEF397|nr:hypothetical protein [Nesterenkonia populi]